MITMYLNFVSVFFHVKNAFIAPNYKPPKSPPTGQQVSKLSYIYTMASFIF